MSRVWRLYTCLSLSTLEKKRSTDYSAGRILQNFLTALDLASITPKRIMLQTGLKKLTLQIRSAIQAQIKTNCLTESKRLKKQATKADMDSHV